MGSLYEERIPTYNRPKDASIIYLHYYNVPLLAFKESHPEVRAEGIYMELTGNSFWGYEQAGPAVMVQAIFWGPEEIIICKVVGDL